MTTVTLDDQLKTEFQAVAAPDEEFSAFLAAVAKDAITRRRQEAAARAEAQAVLNGPRRPWAEADADFRRRHNILDLSHRTREELADDAERIIAAMDPKVREEMEREGWL